MNYKLIVTERAVELMDERIYYLLYKLKNKQAARHLLDGIEKLYDRLEENPFQFSECRDMYLKRMEYREAIVTDMNYLIIFRVEEKTVYVLGIFHDSENYRGKL